MSQTQSQKSINLSEEGTDSEKFQPKEKKSAKKSLSKRTNQSEPKQSKKAEGLKKQRKKGGKKKQKEQKVQKQKQKQKEKQKKQPAKRKPKSKKDGGGGKDMQQNKANVCEYMKKQNRPYNLLNVFDNLHGKIKKPELEIILNELSEEGEINCKQFGKNKVYFLNQDKFDLNMKEVEELSSTYTKLKEQHQVFREENKVFNDEYRKLMARKTFAELEKQVFDLENKIGKLEKKRDSLMNGDVQKVDEKEVKKIEKDSVFLQKELNKRRKLLKQCLSAWSQITQKKVPDIAEQMGIELL